MPAATLARPEAADSNKVHIAVTERGCARQRDCITLLFSDKDMSIEWIDAGNLEEICQAIARRKIDGLLLTSWAGQAPEIARELDWRLLTQNAIHPVPLFANGESALELIKSNGGYIKPSTNNEAEHQIIHLLPGTHLHRWVGVNNLMGAASKLPEPDIWFGDPVFLNAVSLHSEQQLLLVEGIEVQGRILQVGVRFDPVKLYLEPPTGNIEAWSRTSNGVQNLFDGLIEEVRYPRH
jgi:hypothetical protein